MLELMANSNRLFKHELKGSWVTLKSAIKNGLFENPSSWKLRNPDIILDARPDVPDSERFLSLEDASRILREDINAPMRGVPVNRLRWDLREEAALKRTGLEVEHRRAEVDDANLLKKGQSYRFSGNLTYDRQDVNDRGQQYSRGQEQETFSFRIVSKTDMTFKAAMEVAFERWSSEHPPQSAQEYRFVEWNDVHIENEANIADVRDIVIYGVPFRSKDIKAMRQETLPFKFKSLTDHVYSEMYTSTDPVALTLEHLQRVGIDLSESSVADELWDKTAKAVTNASIDAFCDKHNIYPLADILKSSRLRRECAISYIAETCHGKDGLRSLTISVLRELLGPHPTINTIKRLCIDYRISLYCCGLLNDVIEKYVCSNSRAALIFKIVDNHLYPIRNATSRHNVSHNGSLKLEEFDIKERLELGIRDAPLLSDEAEIMFHSEPVLILNTRCLKPAAAHIIESTGFMIEKCAIYNNIMTSFVIPSTNQLVIAGDNWDGRQQLCIDLRAATELKEFDWAGQSLGVLAKTALETKTGRMPSSVYGDGPLDVLRHHFPGPVRSSIARDFNLTLEQRLLVEGYDIRGCHSSILAEPGCDWPVFTAFDSFLPFTAPADGQLLPGLYVTRKAFTLGQGNIHFPAGPLMAPVVSKALLLGVIAPADVTHACIASKRLKADTFTAYVEWMRTSTTRWKDGLNALIGLFGIRYNRDAKVGMCSDIDSALSYMLEYEKQGYDVELDLVSNVQILSVTSRQLKPEGHAFIYAQIVELVKLRLHDMIEAICLPETIVVSINTDGIKVLGPINRTHPRFHIGEKRDCPLGHYHQEFPREDQMCFSLSGRSVSDFESRHADAWVYKPITPWRDCAREEIGRMSMMVQGLGGSGKSFHAASIFNPDTDIVLCHQNVPVNNMKSYGEQIVAHTFDSFLMNPLSGRLDAARLERFKRIFIDEGKMVPIYCMQVLLEAQQRYGCILTFMMDDNQLPAVEGEQHWINWSQNEVFRQMCGSNMIQLPFISGCGRYDDALKSRLDNFISTRVLKPSLWNNAPVTSFNNICFLNKTRHDINHALFDVWMRDNKPASAAVIAIPRKSRNGNAVPDLRIAVGTPLMVYNETLKKDGLYICDRFTVLGTDDDDKVVLHPAVDGAADIVLTRSTIGKIFDYPWTMTCYKAQSISIAGVLNIWEGDMMSYEQIYTSIARARSFANVVIRKARLGMYPKEQAPISTRIKLHAPEPRVGHIYSFSLPGKVYIGLSTQEPEQRERQHYANPTNAKMADALAEGPVHQVLESFKFVYDRTIQDAETTWISKMQADHISMLNEQKVAKTTPKKEVVPKERASPCPSVVKPKQYKFGICDDTTRQRIVCKADALKFRVKASYGSLSGRTREQAVAAVEAQIDEFLAKNPFYARKS